MTGWIGRVLALAAAALLLHLVLIQPNHPYAMTPRALLLFPLELPAILLAIVALPAAGILSRGSRAALVGALVALVILKIADFGMFSALNRGFNPITDLHLVRSGWSLASDAVGFGLAGFGLLAGLGAVLALAAAIWWALAQWSQVAAGRRARAACAAGAALAAVVVVADAGAAMGKWRLPLEPPGAAFTARVAAERVELYRDTIADLAAFGELARTDPFASADGIFSRLDGRDVLIIFVESYGRSSFDSPTYAPTHLATLSRAQARLDAAGLAMRTGWVTSPVSGGQSWLAHATLASGLETGNQTRYAAMLQSQRRTLFHLAQDAGYHTAAIMPGITLAWPEGRRLGFETVLAAGDLGYGGRPFNWVTMPDQYTLSAFGARIPSDDRPVFAMVALISSHAPWVPVPELVAWEAIGDGAIFDRWADSGDPPEVVWRDRDRIRDQYRRAIDYSLGTVMDFAARQGDDGPLLIILGDHQPAGFVAQIESRDVPVHFVGPPEVLAKVEDWGWTPGLAPGPATPVWPMQDFRDRFIRAFSAPPPGGGDS